MSNEGETKTLTSTPSRSTVKEIKINIKRRTPSPGTMKLNP